jgi:hypothetical protein
MKPGVFCPQRILSRPRLRILSKIPGLLGPSKTISMPALARVLHVLSLLHMLDQLMNCLDAMETRMAARYNSTSHLSSQPRHRIQHIHISTGVTEPQGLRELGKARSMETKILGYYIYTCYEKTLRKLSILL